MKRILFVVCCLVITLGSSAQQRNKSLAAKKASSEVVKTQTASSPENNVTEGTATTSIITDRDFNAYLFDVAGRNLQKEIQAARRKHLSTELLEDQVRKARIGQNMLQATEKVIFVDSFVVDKEKILQAYRLSPSCGTIANYGTLFPQDSEASSEQKESTVYLNEFKDKVIFSYPDEGGFTKLYESMKIGNGWSQRQPLEGFSDSTDLLAYPFMLSDGTTLYYAAQDENSLGGYDIYVTRYNPDTKQYLKAENIGMPFNSPANDYLYAIDETSNLGWFVTDRNQPAGKVCVYLFIPTETRNVYSYDATHAESIRNFARITSIKATQTDAKAVSEALARLKSATGNGKSKTASKGEFIFIVANGYTYTKPEDFKSAKAMQMVLQWKNMVAQRDALLNILREQRHQWAAQKGSVPAQTILNEERQLNELDKAIQTQENNIRKEEQKKINVNN